MDVYLAVLICIAATALSIRAVFKTILVIKEVFKRETKH